MEIKDSAPAYQKKHWTIEEYLQMENASDVKHEYYRGEIFAMSGAKMQHNIIAVNLLTGLGTRLRTGKCRPLGSDQRIHIEKNSLFTYPDISVVLAKFKPSIMMNGMFWTQRSSSKYFRLPRKLMTVVINSSFTVIFLR
ncbi:Uma2 family endonuclease [Flavisolibacter sp. BT320]|nr:Uma2 family endonuclease [Flavisolibacter longurius]